MPYERNRFFTGREDTLTRLAQTLQQSNSVAITQSAAISGMGGIGKTQTAVEYAYQNADHYFYFIWMRAETETTLRESFVEVARLLKMREADEPDQNIAVKAVGNWLSTNTNWLLILDNADDLAMAHKFLPITTNGHILYTTRSATSGTYAEPVRIERLNPEDGALLLLRRAKRIAKDAPLDVATPEDRDAALRITKAVDGLPLALDQAGAFIEEEQTSATRYRELFEEQAADLLAEYGNPKERDHKSVAATFSLACKKAEDANPAVGDLLRLCAFLAPDDIPELIFTQGNADALGEHLSKIVGNKLAWEKLLGEACRYSLLSRDSQKRTLSLHRLVQVVLRDAMTKQVQREWAERVINIVNDTFPRVEFKNWPFCDQLLPHAQVCAKWIVQFEITTAKAGRLLSQSGYYLVDQGQYHIAEPLFVQLVEIDKYLYGPEHPTTASSINQLAHLYKSQGHYIQAEPLYLEALAIRKRQLASNPLDLAESLNNLAALYEVQGRYLEAKPLYLDALTIYRTQLGDHQFTATSLNNLAGLYYSQGHYIEAEPLYLEALAIRKMCLESSHPDIASNLNNLAQLYLSQGRYIESKPLYEQALSIYNKILVKGHPATIGCQSNYDLLLQAMRSNGGKSA